MNPATQAVTLLPSTSIWLAAFVNQEKNNPLKIKDQFADKKYISLLLFTHLIEHTIQLYVKLIVKFEYYISWNTQWPST